MTLNRRYTRWWYAIIAAFGVVELCALLDKRPGGTLTEHVREWLKLQSKTAWTGRIIAIAFLAWLSNHFLNPKPQEVDMLAFLVPILAAAKTWIIRIAVGYATKLLVDEVKKAVPGLWAKVPAAIKPIVSTVLGAATAVVTGDPTTMLADAVGGAVGGATGKVVHDEQVKTENVIEAKAAEAKAVEKINRPDPPDPTPWIDKTISEG